MKNDTKIEKEVKEIKNVEKEVKNLDRVRTVTKEEKF